MRRLVWVTCAVVLALTAGSAGVEAASAATAQTTITMNVVGCDGCTITPSQYWKRGHLQYNGKPAKVVNGAATLVVPTANTRGMYFAIDAPWKVQINAQPLITVQYQGQPVGSVVTRAQALDAKRASACWAGTAAPTVSIDVTVKRVFMPAFPNEHHRTPVPLAYFTPTAKAAGGFSSTYRGVLATQDVWPCP